MATALHRRAAPRVPEYEREGYGADGSHGDQSEYMHDYDDDSASPSDRAQIDININARIEIPTRKRGKVESILWVLAAAAIYYYGDGKSDLVTAILYDFRVQKQQFFVACICALVNFCVYVYIVIWRILICRDNRPVDLILPGSVASATILGFLAFLLFCSSLWPIWGFLIIPMMVVLFMALVVVSSLLPPYPKPTEEESHSD
eukprot:TRINITY_DN7652_c0_g1_i1.p1 TRINITY_DN7652_c0_g1~~TRINITY_DN7652_c0_g1_i1.p1  ORF type:complete len:203 (+),score=22.83 TRINITY_DN7652_c0_g1_i1:34-642(+)